MNDPVVSVIVAVRNGQGRISACIESLLALDYPAYEILVVDDNSQDDTAVIAGRYAPRVRLIVNESQMGPAESRNRGCRAARGDMAAFIDGDCIADRNWLQELARGFRGNDAAGVGGAQDVPVDETGFGRKVSAFLKTAGFISDYVKHDSRTIIRVSHNPSCNVMYKKDVLMKEGGFLKGLWPGEDVELDYRLGKKGYRLYFNSQARVSHYRADTVVKFGKMMWRYGWAQGFLVRRYGFFRKIQYFPILVLVLASLFVLAARSGVPLFILILAFFLCAFLLAGLWNTLLGICAAVCWNCGFFSGLFAGNPKERMA